MAVAVVKMELIRSGMDSAEMQPGTMPNSKYPATAAGLLCPYDFAAAKPSPGPSGRISLPFCTLTPEYGSFEISRLPSRSA